MPTAPITSPTTSWRGSSSCGSGAGGANIYVSGYNGNDTTAVYWQNGTQVNLNNDSRPAKAAGIFVDSGNIYVVGQCDTSTTAYACYWTNGTKTFLKSTSTTDYQTIGNCIYVPVNNSIEMQ